MRLVVCVDRDDDLGRKAGVTGPVIGRAAAIEAATRLAVADAEDSDTNAIFAAVGLLDELKGAGEDVDLCVLTGSPKVGVLSDRRVAQQFDDVLAKVHAASAYLVSDGAEDEYLFPILASRIRIDGVRRVYVRQSASLESTYYTLVRALKDPKLRAKTVLPFAFVLLTLGIAAAGGVFIWGVIGLAILLGVYLIFWTFDIDEAIIDSLRSAAPDIRQGSGAIPFTLGIVGVAIVGFGFQEGYNVGVRVAGPVLLRIFGFLQTGVPWWVAGALVLEVGRAVRRMFVRGRFPRGFAVAATSMIGVGFVSYGMLDVGRWLEGAFPSDQLLAVVAFLAAGFALLFGAMALQQYWKFVARRSAAESAPTSG
jgi:putative membrane protein